ncbi:unnamed protein product [Oncorhynchus mykiss]|uniref:Uncharacterized protein n=1 Tax=Oncorhynchus mykiss TaxID=8022 RepID=A0A060Y7A0_ONCMY|nr:unnamed protein product [Oncorhynchus mykiss]
MKDAEDTRSNAVRIRFFTWGQALVSEAVQVSVGEQNQEGQVHLRVTGCLDNKSTDQSEESNTILVLSIVGLMAALLTISYVTVTNMLIQRRKKNPQEQLLDAPFEKKDLMLIYTLGPNWSGQASIKHDVCVRDRVQLVWAHCIIE